MTDSRTSLPRAQRGGRSDGTARAVWLLAVLACLSVGPTVRLSDAQDSLPIGFGTLKRDDIVVRLATDQVEIQVLPLDDAAQRAGVRHPTLVMVTFYGLVPQARFAPEDINLTSRGRLFRPVGIVPLSPSWNGQQLEARQQAVALYLFDEGITFREPLTVSYAGLSNDGWSRGAMRALERERARVLARAQARQGP